MASLSRYVWVAFCLLGAAYGGCRNSHEPGAGGEELLVGGGESGRLVVASVAELRVVARVGSWGRYPGPYARSPDSATLYFVANGEASGWELVALDTRSLDVAWRERLRDGESWRVIDGVELRGGSLAVSPDGSKLFVAIAYREGVRGVAVIDAKTRNLVGFVGPVSVTAGLVTQPPSPTAPAGAVLALGARTTDPQPAADSLLIIDATTLDITLADPVAPRTGASRVQLWQALPAPDGRHIYIVAESGLYKYNIVSRQVVATAPRPSFGGLTVSPDGTALYMTDPGDAFDNPGSGLLYVYGPDLERHEPIDLTAAAVNGIPPVTRVAAVSRDGAAVYVTTGTPSRGPLYGPQPSRVVVVDAVVKKVRAIVPLGDWGVGPIFVR